MEKKRKTYKLLQNNIPQDVHLKARLVMKRLLNTPPESQKEILKKEKVAL